MGVHHVAIGLRHLPSVRAGDETVHDDALGQRLAGTHQHRGPDDRMEPTDVLADDVHVSGPKSAQRLGLVGPIHAADVVAQRIEPDVHDVRLPIHRIFGAGHAPVEAATADGEVAHLHATKALEDLAPVLGGLDELLVVLDVLDDSRGVLREPEEKTGFAHLLQRHPRARVLEVPLRGLLVRDEALLPNEVPALVVVEVDVASVLALHPHRPRHLFVLRRGGAHVEVVGHLEPLVEGLEAQGVSVADVDRRHVLALRGLRDLLAMLVRARHVEDVLAHHAVEAREDIRGERLVGMAHVRPAIAVVDRGGDVIPAGGRLCVAGHAGRPRAHIRRNGRGHSDFCDLLSLAVDDQHLLLPPRGGGRPRRGSGGAVGIGEAVRELRPQPGQMPVPARDVGKRLPVREPLDLGEPGQVLLRGFRAACDIRPVSQQRIQLRQAALGLQAADRDAGRHGAAGFSNFVAPRALALPPARSTARRPSKRQSWIS
mmetsp:Transcript_13021/g.35492  ORF Transcript_13021/g.35492 Transcript_13021/m.35492 type:complete len:485 (+) Transcript_13021:1374-2828(+)